jgi:peptidoglycan/xylan/chitin deacetylase (PgdA/CDA1 family)
MDRDGHQLASHTWTHPDLSTLGEDARREEMYRLETAFKTLVGKTPTYMRPPFSSCNAACLATMDALGYHVVYFDVDTDDYDNDSPELIGNSRNRFQSAVAGTDPATRRFLTIAHDIHEQTVRNLAKFMLDTLKTAGYRGLSFSFFFLW